MKLLNHLYLIRNLNFLLSVLFICIWRELFQPLAITIPATGENYSSHWRELFQPQLRTIPATGMNYSSRGENYSSHKVFQLSNVALLFQYRGCARGVHVAMTTVWGGGGTLKTYCRWGCAVTHKKRGIFRKRGS